MLQEDFKDEVARIAAIVRPFVHWSVLISPVLLEQNVESFLSLNDLISIPNDDDEDEEDGEENEEAADGEEGEEDSEP